MNTSQKNPSTIPWGKILIVFALVAIVGVISGRAGLEDLFNLEPGTLGGPAVAERPDDDGTENKSENGKSSTPKNASDNNSANQNNAQSDKPENSSQGQATAPQEFELKRNGFVLESPEGLTYYIGDRGENRLDHVMRHAKDIPNRPGSHGVFMGDKNEILSTIDEAYSLVKADSAQVISSEKDDERPTFMAYEIDMKRKIGFKGGQTGGRAGNPALTTLKLILNKGNRVITAYPYR